MRHYAQLKAAHEAERRRVKTPKELEELEYRRKEKEAQHLLGQQLIDEEQRESLLAQRKNPAPSAKSRREAEAVRKKQALAVENEQSRLAHELRDRGLGIASDRRPGGAFVPSQFTASPKDFQATRKALKDAEVDAKVDLSPSRKETRVAG